MEFSMLNRFCLALRKQLVEKNKQKGIFVENTLFLLSLFNYPERYYLFKVCI
jgi:hypothetical protein